MLLSVQPRILIVVGMAAQVFATMMMRFDNDFLTGLGFGFGVSLLGLGVYSIRKTG